MIDDNEERDIQSVLGDARRGKWDPVLVLVGTETFLIERVVRLLRKATVGDGPRGFNDDLFHGSGLQGGKVAAAARTLVGRGVLAVGIDALSIGGFHHDLAATHRILLSAGVWVIEGLDLTDIEPGEYELACLPLRLTGADGAPARAALRRR